jgi:hypothetical protein
MRQTDQPVWESEFDKDYRYMAHDNARETEALELAEATIGDVSDDTREG